MNFDDHMKKLALQRAAAIKNLQDEDFPPGPVIQESVAIILTNGSRMVEYRCLDGSKWLCVTDDVSRKWVRR